MFARFVGILGSVILLNSCAGLLLPDCSKVRDDFEKFRECRAKNGDREAQYNIGREAFVDEDYKTALKWLKIAAEPNSGYTYIYIPPVGSQKYGTTKRVDTHDAHPGHSGAQTLLAEIYEKGLGVKPDPKKAEKYRKKTGL
ncbi:tetratricopeptide repeat protein [Emcibacter sp.]|uniref:tetratricopeptide repeat protein n=1 Tax=Emcibacter sp. TaxID=1979954 RepID=UPI003A904328